MPKKGRPQGTTIPAETRFWRKVDKTPGHGPDGDCWLWTGGKAGKNYGYFSVHITYGESHRNIYAHRFSFQLTNGEIPNNLLVLHRCDNPPCVNPAHLFLGTQRENMDDMVQKGRQNKGEKNAAAKLTREKVMTIRTLYATGNYSLKDLGGTFGVAFQTISDAVNFRYWKNT